MAPGRVVVDSYVHFSTGIDDVDDDEDDYGDNDNSEYL